MPRLAWNASKRRVPRNASRRTRSVQRSPMTESVRAIVQSSFPTSLQRTRPYSSKMELDAREGGPSSIGRLEADLERAARAADGEADGLGRGVRAGAGGELAARADGLVVEGDDDVAARHVAGGRRRGHVRDQHAAPLGRLEEDGHLGRQVLHREPPEVRRGRRAPGRGAREQLLSDQDRAVEAERERDRVARARIDGELLFARALEVERGEVGVVAQLADHYARELASQALDQLLHQVVRQRARRRHALHLERDGLCLEGPDPDGQLAVGLRLLDQADDRRAAVGIEHDAVHLHLDRPRRRGGPLESSDTDQHEERPPHDPIIVPQAAIQGGGARCRDLPRIAMGGGRQRPARRALVLAGGGIVGGLYEVGALLALDSVCEGFSTCDFDLYVGSSAGAFVAALLANRVSAERLRVALESDQRTLPRLSVSRFMSLPWRSYLGTAPRLAAALPRLVGDLWAHWDEAFVLDTAASLLRVLPCGIFSLDGLERYVRSVLTQAGRTNDFRRLRRRLFVPATALDSGAIRVFGARLDERTPISRAVAASAAVPLLFEPVTVDGVQYVDATVAKTAHARLAVERGAGLVVVVNPMRPLLRDPKTQPPLADGGPFAVAGQALRIAIHRRLHDGLARHAYTSPATDFVLLEPYERDLRLFDYPLMTYSLRHEGIRRWYRTTVKTILGDYERYAEVFGRGRVTLLPRREIERRAHRWSRASGGQSQGSPALSHAHTAAQSAC